MVLKIAVKERKSQFQKLCVIYILFLLYYCLYFTYANLEALKPTKAYQVALYFQMLPSSIPALYHNHLHLKIKALEKQE